jgi:hypothetical protein
MIDRPEYAQQELVIAESVQLPDRRVPAPKYRCPRYSRASSAPQPESSKAVRSRDKDLKLTENGSNEYSNKKSST